MYTLLVTGDVPGAAGYFNPLLQQTIIPCTSGTRPSSPAEGWHVYETDTNAIAKYNGSAWEYVSSSRTLFTPTLTASSINPTMGTGNVRFGWWCYMPGACVAYNFFVKFGASGSAAGTGTYAISLPVAAASPYASGHCAVGSAQIADNSSGAFQPASLFIANGGSTLAMVGTAPVTEASPWAWTNNDYVSGSVVYPI